MLKKEIKELINKYGRLPDYSNGVPVSGKIYDQEELGNAIEAVLEGWWTEGKWALEFEDGLKKFLGVKYVLPCNSGSSANLLAIATLCSPTLKERQIKPGDEIITLACGFPTTVNPIIQMGCTPVFVDIDLETYDVKIDDLDKALSKKTKAVILPHTLGNPFNLEAVTKFCHEHKLWLVEDNCDALGSKYKGKFTGTFGDIATLSFYPAHQITTAEGGAVITNNPTLNKICRSIRDWGRHCWCPTGYDNTCKNRYNWKLGELPEGFDHKYIYGELGYNLKISDLHAAIGVAQLKKLPKFIKARQQNFDYLQKKLASLKAYIDLPSKTADSDPCWFGFLISVKDGVDREDLLRHLSDKKIGTRLLFGGNLTKQPYFVDGKFSYRQIGDLNNTDLVMAKTFWLGVFPGVTKAMIDYVADILTAYFEELK